MNVLNYVNELAAQGVELWLEGDKLKYQAPTDVMTSDKLTTIRQYKTDIIDVLKLYAGTEGTFPLSYSQQSLWSLNQLNPSSPAYNVTYAARLNQSKDDPIDSKRLSLCLEYLVARHPILRTTYKVSNGKPVQKVTKLSTVTLAVETKKNASDIEIEAWIKQQANEPFDLTTTPIRLTLMQNHLGIREDAILLITIHHIAADFWSLEVLVNELSTLYDKSKRGVSIVLDPIGKHYQDHVQQEQTLLEGHQGTALESFWDNTIPTSMPSIDLPTDFPRPATKTENGRFHVHALDAGLYRSLKYYAAERQVTPYTLILSVYRLFLHKLSGQPLLAIGAPTSGRNQPGMENVMGHFVNTSVIVSSFTDSMSVNDFLDDTKETVINLLDHQDYPFPLLVKRLRPPRDSSRSPVFQVMYNWNKAKKSTEGIVDENKLPLIDEVLFASSTGSGGATHDLTLNIYDYSNKYETVWTYNIDLFHASTITRYAQAFERLLSSVIGNSEQTVSECFNSVCTFPGSVGMSSDYPIQRHATQEYELNHLDCLAFQFQRGAEFGEPRVGKFSYESVASLIETLSRELAAFSIPQGAVVGVDLGEGKDVDQTNCILSAIICSALLKQQMCFGLNLDKPTSSNGTCDDFTHQFEYIITYDSNRYGSVNTIELGGVPTTNDTPFPTLHLVRKIGGSLDRAIISAGRNILKKQGNIDIIEYSAFCGLVENIRAHWGLSPETNVCLTPGSKSFFNVALGIAVINSGSRCELVGGEFPACEVTDAGLPEADIYFLPPYCKVNVERLSSNKPYKVVYLKDKGMPLGFSPQSLVLKLKEEKAELIYTQHIDAGILLPFSVQKGVLHEKDLHQTHIKLSSVCVAQENVCVVDSFGQGTEAGACGKVYLSDNSAVIKQSSSERWTDTGIVVRWTEANVRNAEDDASTFQWVQDNERPLDHPIGQYDASVIEANLWKFPDIEFAWVHPVTVGEETINVAYYRSSTGEQVDSDELDLFMRARLSDYMLPAQYILLEQLPFDVFQRLDEALLPKPILVDKKKFQMPTNDIEHRLAAIWCEVLDVEKISINDDFFELGGDSILGAIIISNAMTEGLFFSAKDIFDHYTIAALARVVSTESSIEAEQGLVSGVMPVSPAQYWFFEKIKEKRNQFNQSLLIEMKAEPDIMVLTKAVNVLLSHHDQLRARYIINESGDRLSIEQLIESSLKQPFEQPLESTVMTDYGNQLITNEQMENRVDFSLVRNDIEFDEVIDEAQGSLDIESGSLIKVRWIDRGSIATSRLLVVVHHLAIDGLSWYFLLNDLETIYNALLENKQFQLPPKTSSYKTWVNAIHNVVSGPSFESEQRHWLDLDLNAQQLDIHSPRWIYDDANQERYSQTQTVAVNALRTKVLQQKVHNAYQTDIADILVSALVMSLSHWQGNNKVLVDLEGHGRDGNVEGVEITRTVGWFTSIYPVLFELDVEEESQVIKYVKEQIRSVPDKGVGYGITRYLSESHESHTFCDSPYLFNYVGDLSQLTKNSKFYSGQVTPASFTRHGDQQRTHLMVFNVYTVNEELKIDCDYSTKIYSDKVISDLLSLYQRQLDKLIDHCIAPDLDGGFTPSDMPDILVNQNELDEIIEELAFLDN